MADQNAVSAQPDAETVHEYASEAEKCLEQLATGLGQIGADPKAVEAIGQMADVVRKIAGGLAKGMKEQPAEPSHSMDSATDEMMASRHAPQA